MCEWRMPSACERRPCPKPTNSLARVYVWHVKEETLEIPIWPNLSF